jgi:hypothetical protein
MDFKAAPVRRSGVALVKIVPAEEFSRPFPKLALGNTVKTAVV